MIYVIDDGSKYSLDYSSLRDDYWKYKNMSDEDFIENIVDILHFCCVVSYLKQLSAEVVLIDNGIIHELIHLLAEDTRNDALYRLKKIRLLFNKVMELA